MTHPGTMIAQTGTIILTAITSYPILTHSMTHTGTMAFAPTYRMREVDGAPHPRLSAVPSLSREPITVATSIIHHWPLISPAQPWGVRPRHNQESVCPTLMGGGGDATQSL
ncbi:hypothetical protein Pcinc_031731 [Petrolisthes cinctipes]|uniref:Uncharacterized protein n=1 Tax=Petrolisthes cinctipes TaxID=88211 RepID=A0AAE1EVU1_PETCI|nr:hypothetical protein Pcinc_031731 [Petrolisthes cinctipes]